MTMCPGKLEDEAVAPHAPSWQVASRAYETAFIDALEQLVLTADPHGMVDYVNRRWQDYTGLSLLQSIGLGFARAIDRADANSTLLTWTTSVGQPKPWQMILRLRQQSNGCSRWFLLNVTPMLDPHGSIERWICSCTDIDQQKQLENSQRFLAEAGVALAATLDYEATLALVGELAVQQLADWCVVDLVDEAGRWQRKVVAHARPEDGELAMRLRSFCCCPQDDLSNYAPNRAIQEKRSILVPQLDAQQIKQFTPTAADAELLAEIGVRSMLSVPLVAHDRTLGVITLGRTPREPPLGEGERVIAEDLARCAGLAADNARLYKKAQEAADLREAFLSIASHELRTPLTSLLLQADGLVRSLQKDEAIPHDRLQTKLQRILKQAERLQRLIENLLDVSRIAKGHLGLEAEQVDLVEITSDVLQRFRSEAEHSHCATHIDSSGPVYASLDRLRVEQIVTNLLGNAIRYGRGNPIDVGVQPHGDNVVLLVRDHGIGIDPVNHQRIFERFGRATSDRNYGGLGLGLWIVRQIVEAMGGAISVESALGSGSTFTVVLPRGGVT